MFQKFGKSIKMQHKFEKKFLRDTEKYRHMHHGGGEGGPRSSGKQFEQQYSVRSCVGSDVRFLKLVWRCRVTTVV